LRNTFERTVRDRRAHLVTIYGEPGVGKSRLARDFIAGLDGVTVLVGRSLPYGEGITYWPLAEMVKAWAGIVDDDSAAQARQQLIAAPLPERGNCEPARACSRCGRGRGWRSQPPGDRVGCARMGRAARCDAAARARVWGRPLGLGAGARPDGASRGA